MIVHACLSLSSNKCDKSHSKIVPLSKRSVCEATSVRDLAKRGRDLQADRWDEANNGKGLESGEKTLDRENNGGASRAEGLELVSWKLMVVVMMMVYCRHCWSVKAH